MQFYQTHDTLLRNALTSNGLFSALSGMACLSASSHIAEILFAKDFLLLGLSPSGIIWELGLGLLVFSGLGLFTARQHRLSLGRAKLISLLDIVWLGGSAILLTGFLEYFSSSGLATILVVATIVLLFAIAQLLGVALMYQGESDVTISTHGDRMIVRANRYTKASPKRAWQVMSHHESYANVAENISKVEVIEGEREGMIRQCFDNKGRSWRETCLLWDEGRAFAFQVHTEAEDYPYPIAQLTGEWSISPSQHGTQIMMVFQVQGKSGLVNHMLFKMMAAPFAGICDRLLLKWGNLMENQTAMQAPKNIHEMRAIRST